MRCPNGTRKNKQGVCQPKTSKPTKQETTEIKKRCPNGTRKNKQGICEPKNLMESDTKSTPRTNYFCKYFKKQVTMSKNNLFQIHFDSPDQFKNYVNLSNNPTLDCGYQTLFALGLIEVDHAKKSSEEVNTKGKLGISTNDLKIFFRTNFGFTSSESIETRDSLNAKIFLQDKLENNYATILLFKFEKFNHYVVCYKYKNKIYFYDPQKNRYVNINEKTIFIYFKVKVNESKVFQPIQKSIPFIG